MASTTRCSQTDGCENAVFICCVFELAGPLTLSWKRNLEKKYIVRNVRGLNLYIKYLAPKAMHIKSAALAWLACFASVDVSKLNEEVARRKSRARTRR